MTIPEIIGNGISDHWSCKCYVSAVSIFQPIYSSFELLFNNDALNWFVFELLLLLPLFFRLYGFGVQQKLTKFYNETRRQLINYQFLFGFTTVLCSILQIFIPQASACVIWDGISYGPLRSNNPSPSQSIVLVTVLLLTIACLSIERRLFYVIGVIIILSFLILSSILSGATSIAQAILSLAMGACILFIYRFVPPISIPLSSLIAIVGGIILFSIDIHNHQISDDLVQYSVVPGICGCFILVVNLYHFFRFISYQNNYGWFTVNWVQVDKGSSDCIATAVIPGVIEVKNGDEFGERLFRDIIDGAICFLALLIFNGIISKAFSYRFFNAG